MSTVEEDLPTQRSNWFAGCTEVRIVHSIGNLVLNSFEGNLQHLKTSKGILCFKDVECYVYGFAILVEPFPMPLWSMKQESCVSSWNGSHVACLRRLLENLHIKTSKRFFCIRGVPYEFQLAVSISVSSSS